MVQNTVQNGAKRKAKSINIHRKCINKAFKNHEIHGKKRKNGHQKVGFQGLKVVFWAAKTMGWQVKQKGKMVQNADGFLKIEHIVRR